MSATYRMRTTAMHETSSGIYWHADLLLDGRLVGHIEQDGRGGADRVTFQFLDDRRAWSTWVDETFAGDEEAATATLMHAEDALLLGEVTA